MKRGMVFAMLCALLAGFYLPAAGQNPVDEKAAKEKAKLEKQERERQQKEAKKREEAEAKARKREMDEMKKRPPSLNISASEQAIVGAFISDFSRQGFNIENQTPNTVMLVRPVSGQRGFWGQVLLGNAYTGPPREYLVLTVSRNGEQSLAVMQCGVYVQFPFNKRDTYDMTKKEWENLLGYLGRLKSNAESQSPAVSTRESTSIRSASDASSSLPLAYKDMAVPKNDPPIVRPAPQAEPVTTPAATPAPPIASGAKVKWTIETTPAGAAITIDGIEVGKSPQTITLTSGQHRVSLSLFGYKTWEREMTVTEGKFTLRLEPAF